MEDLIAEAKGLVNNGVKELILVAQETTIYGLDLYGEKTLAKLLKELCKIEGLEWIRVLYAYPEEINDKLIQVMKEEDKVCNYIDIPIQHASDNILRRMGRKTNKQELIDIINKLRENIPDIAIRTTLISGFPGETEQDHQELLEFVKDMKFDRLGVFTYSREEDTPAATMEGQIDEDLKEKRRDEIMSAQQKIVFEKSKEMVGSKLSVLIEGKIPTGDSFDFFDKNHNMVYIGRTYRDLPDVDYQIYVPSSTEIISGDFIDVEVTGDYDYDLIGSRV